MYVNGPNSTNTSLAPDGLEGASLSPDALMSYCAMRLRNLDDQVAVAFKKQQAANANSQQLSELMDRLNWVGGPIDGTKDEGKQTLKNVAGTYYYYAQHVSDPALAKKLADKGKFFEDLATNGGSLDQNMYKSNGADFVGSLQKDLNAGTELSMINLQSIMSQRQSAVQLVTNMVQSLGDQMNKVVSNVGH
jgi:hypothetical protein